MNEQHRANNKTVNRTQRARGILAELRDAGFTRIVLLTSVLTLVYAVAVNVLEIPWARLGQFGDSFGALSALLNALALAALVATVVLQSKELRETREQLVLQARAQRESADSAREQIAQTQRLEHLKLRPVIKAEWLPAKPGFDHSTIQMRLRNVGLGVAIVDTVEILWIAESMGFHESALSTETSEAWRRTVEKSLGERGTLVDVRAASLDDSNRALAVGEYQALVFVELKHRVPLDEVMRWLQAGSAPIVHFRSIVGEKFDTQNQFAFAELAPDQDG